MTTTEHEAAPAVSAEIDGATADGAAMTPDEPPEEGTTGRFGHRPPVAAGALLAVAAGVGVALLVAARRSTDVRRVNGGRVLFASRPRKVMWRYVGTLGLWELARRATRFTVTEDDLFVEEGVLRQASQRLPLAAVHTVRVVNGPWQGYVELGGAGGSALLARRLGPLRTKRARELADVISMPTARERPAHSGRRRGS
jgi:hypothetical protein